MPALRASTAFWVGPESRPKLRPQGRCRKRLTSKAASRLTDGDVRDDTGARSQHGEILDGDAAAQAGLGNDDAVAADQAVMSDLTEIIDLGSFADDGVAQSAAVDLGARSDLDVVVNDDTPDLRDLDMLLAVGDVAEAVLADMTAGVNHHPVSDMGVGNAAAGADGAIGPDLDPFADHGVRRDQRATRQFWRRDRSPRTGRS